MINDIDKSIFEINKNNEGVLKQFRKKKMSRRLSNHGPITDRSKKSAKKEIA
jgi:hypothetical protein